MISAAEYQRRLNKVMNLSVLQDMVYQLILKDEVTLKMLKEQDFEVGNIHGDGTLFSYKNPSYEAMKTALNPLAGGSVDLIFTGAFVQAMFINKPNSGVYTFGNTDSKKGILSENYGNEIFGLNQDVFNEYQQNILAPLFIQEIKDTANIG